MYFHGPKFHWTPKTTAGLEQIDAEIELINPFDLRELRNNSIGENEIRRIHVRARLNTEMFYLCINENIRQALGLETFDKKYVQLDDGGILECDFVDYLTLKFENRTIHVCPAIVLPGDTRPVLGRFPLSQMDVVLDPITHQLIINPEHPDEAIGRI